MNFVRVSNAWKISLFSKKGEEKKTTFDIEEICRISMMKKKKKKKKHLLKNATDQRTKMEFFSEEESSYSNDVLLLETDVLETGSPPRHFSRG